MTSKNSFWASCKENHKRRIWVWIIAVLAQMMIYVGVLTVYLSRIRMRNADGIYKTGEEYQNALYQAAKDALAFQDNMLFVLIGLAVIIGVQGFSYLYDRRKVDLYHSVPVDKNRRFVVVYVNGVIIYLTSTLSSLLLGVIVAAIQVAVNSEVMAVIGLGFLWNLLFFMVAYHTVILAVMLTGNRFVTFCAAGMILCYESVAYMIIQNLKYSYFDTMSEFYVTYKPKLSIIYDYDTNVRSFKHLEVIKVAKGLLPYYGKWFILAIVLWAAAWWCYRKRPSEAAGKAIAFVKIEPFVKMAVAILLGVGLGMWVHNAAYGNEMLTAASMAGGGLIVCAGMEVIYDFDIKSLFRHLVSSGITTLAIIFIFLVFKMDLFGYDDYIPSADEVDDIALNVDYYGQFWDENFEYVDAAKFSEAHMHLQDVEPVLVLAGKSRQEDVKDMTDARYINVLYRLKSGKRVGRRFWVDFDNPDNEELLNRIMGSRDFIGGTYQIMTDQNSFEYVNAMTYSNGATNVALPAEDALKLREAYVKDMEKFDFSLAINNRPCGRINIRFRLRNNWFGISLDVYDSFENTIAYLQSGEAYYPVELNPEDIEDITITNFHNELYANVDYNGGIDPRVYSAVNAEAVWVADSAYEEGTSVKETFTDVKDIAQIVPHIYPEYLSATWNHLSELDDNYDIYITFKKDTTYPYDRSQFGVYYKFYTGQAPEFVKEATALGAKEE